MPLSQKLGKAFIFVAIVLLTGCAGGTYGVGVGVGTPYGYAPYYSGPYPFGYYNFAVPYGRPYGYGRWNTYGWPNRYRHWSRPYGPYGYSRPWGYGHRHYW